ncbi:hypothetical protein [Flavobacterium reichenbachii]|jgi:hypothetical protein|uniref:Uncharacterized protein n=1 Tax=Flavobacterium reichenbachii TaxID=362418 RepID=A0A085ZFP1_9FLAO|nr:hypothetical protein [Flavobacterium reichenbachii]KFF03255.1 hypothetical protein IW19_20350 [Flavobacterium reichenbachii]OXB15236.1 hypothetical protein B0A68_10970 [Flavobacterium reichenbachii]
MAYTSATIKELIKLGGNLTVTGKFSSAHLKDFVNLAKNQNVQITLKINGTSSATLKELVKIGHSKLVLEL